jgi:hypothetical protein
MTPRQQSFAAASLWTLMAVTRLAHLGLDVHLPDASLAVFFAAALLMLPARFFLVLCASAFAADLLSLGVSSAARHCFTLGYLGMLGTYGVMWLAGRFAARQRLLSQVPVLAGASVLAFLSSSGSYYLFSGRFADPTLAEFGERVARYLPNYFATTFAYGAVTIAALAILRERNGGRVSAG